MKTSLNVGIFEHRTPIDRMIAETARAGFDAVELAATPDGPLTFASGEADCIQIAKLAGRAGLEISALAVEDFRDVNFASPDPARRKAAYERTVAALDRAAWLGTDAVIIVPAVTGKPRAPQPRTSYEDAYSLALEALLALRFEAEQRAVHIGCKNCWNRFLPSPIEMRGFIDQVNSPWIGACLDLAGATACSYPQDWIMTLGHRIVRVYFTDFSPDAQGPGGFSPLGEGDIDWPDVMASLKRIHYDGPATGCGRGDPANLAARLARVLQSTD